MSSCDHSGGANADQAKYWNSDPGKTWIEFQQALDAIMQPLTERLIERAAPAAGERVLDVGCGTGATSMAFAAKVGPGGSVVGLDISQVLLDRAEERRAETRPSNLQYRLADAQIHVFAPSSFDLLVSRFGVMFFADPVAAFRNLAVALRAGGRLAFVSWAGMSANPWFEIPRNAAIKLLGEPPPVEPGAPGPLAFANTGYVLDILRQAAWADVSADVEEVYLSYPGNATAAAQLSSSLGPAARVVREMNGGPEHAAEIARQVAESFEQYSVDGAVRVPATVNFFAAVKRVRQTAAAAPVPRAPARIWQ